MTFRHSRLKELTMQTNKKVSELQQYLPHRAPMVWVDRVLEVGSNEKGIFGVCSVLTDAESLFLNNGGQLNGSAAIEFTAQAYGYVRALYHVLNNIDNTPTRTYLTGVRSCAANFKKFSSQDLKDLRVSIQLTRELHPLVFVKGRIYLEGQESTLAEAEVQVYAE